MITYKIQYKEDGKWKFLVNKNGVHLSFFEEQDATDYIIDSWKISKYKGAKFKVVEYVDGKESRAWEINKLYN